MARNQNQNMEDNYLKLGGMRPIQTPPEPPPKPSPLPPGGLAKVPVGDLSGLPEEPKLRRVAKFLILIGSEEAAGILKHLDQDQVEAISAEIATIRGIGAEEGEAILEEFRRLFSSPYAFSGGARGGVDEARRLLYAAFGPEKGEQMLQRSAPQPAADSAFAFLEDFTGPQIALLLKGETPQAQALVLSRVKPNVSAAALAAVDKNEKLDIVKRIARQAEVSPEVLEQVAAALREKARTIGRDDSRAVDGMGALTAILKAADMSFGDKLLDELAVDDPELGRDLKDRLYTLDDVSGMEDRPLQRKLSEMDDKAVALLLKGRNDAFADKILSNMSAQRRAIIREEMDIMGPVKKQDADKAAAAFLAWFRQGRESGQIVMLNDDDVIR